MTHRFATAVAATAPALVLARRVLRDWGATKSEQRLELPGDDLVPDPATVVTRAVSVDAPAGHVWPWLVQMGQDKAGLYSYQCLENLFGLDIHNADRIHPEWQQLQVGDPVRLVPPGRFGLAEGLSLTVAQIVPERALVLFVAPWHAVWSFHLRPRSPYSCRLISRSRGPLEHGVRRLPGELLDPVTAVMTRRMLLGLKERAEGDVAEGAA